MAIFQIVLQYFFIVQCELEASIAYEKMFSKISISLECLETLESVLQYKIYRINSALLLLLHAML